MGGEPVAVEITVDESTVTFRNTAGACGDLSLTDSIGASGPLYVYVGGGTNYNHGEAVWNSIEICSDDEAPTRGRYSYSYVYTPPPSSVPTTETATPVAEPTRKPILLYLRGGADGGTDDGDAIARRTCRVLYGIDG